MQDLYLINLQILMMLVPTFLLTLLSVSIASSATPIIQPRACTTVAPSVINPLEQMSPDFHYNGTLFHLSHIFNATEDGKTLLTFTDIPEGSTGCMLQLNIPILLQPELIATGAGTQADMWTVSPDNPLNATWNNQPRKLTKVASTMFPTTNTTAPFETILYSDSCRCDMTFLFELSSFQDSEFGAVNFLNDESLKWKQGVDTGPMGFSMVYDC